MEQVAWAKGLITDYNSATNEHTIAYDINTPDESWESVDLSCVFVSVAPSFWSSPGPVILELAASSSSRQSSAFMQFCIAVMHNSGLVHGSV